MIDIDLIVSKYDPKDYHIDYQAALPVPWITFDDFLPADVLQGLQTEIDTIPQHVWSDFTRNGSFMRECNNFRYAPYTRMVSLYLNSGEFLQWLEALTGHQKIIGDPHLIGAGLMRCYQGNSLNLHIDFNWNEQLHLNRCLSMILYTSREWHEDWGGALEFWDFNKTQCVHRIVPRTNRLLIWDYDERLIHGHPTALTCPTDTSRDGLRMFYFKSNAVPLTAPHRSLYWFADDSYTAYDKREHR